jgi:radical SAM superfamily enzyme YgiQ (UPF0313 family)
MKKTKIFLIYVRDEDFYHLLPERLNKNKDHGRVKVMAFPPLGIQTLAPVLRKHGHEVIMFDTCHPDMKKHHIAARVKEESPDVIALSFLSTTSYRLLKSMAKALKTVTPNIPIITGGPFATENSDHILEDCPYIDCVGPGEGEELLPDYLDHFHDPESVAGLVWRKGDTIIRNPPRPMLKDLDNFPYPDRETLPIDYIESLPLDIPAVLSMDKFCTIQTSRGCPYKCIYCDIPALNQGKWRFRSPEHVLGEMQELSDKGYKSIYLTDDHFLLKNKRIEAICEGIIERNLKFKWGCEGRVDSVGLKMMPLLAKANCNFLAFGIEAGTQKILDRLKKDQTLEQVDHAIHEAKNQGIEKVHGFFVVGSPDEKEEDILDSFRFAARLPLDSFGFNRLCVYRGTPLWDEYVERGLIDDDNDWHKWFRCSEVDPTVLPADVVHETRKKGYKLLIKYLILHHPVRTVRLIRRFSKHMRSRDVLKLILSPFRKIDHSKTQKLKDPDLELEPLDKAS